MKSFQDLFQEMKCNQIYYNGMLVERSFSFVKHGKFKFRFKFIQTNSTFTQAIDVYFIDFRGNIKINGKSIRLSKGNYPHVVFFENSSPKEIELDLEIQQGWISICNASDPIGTNQFAYSMILGCAMIKQELSKNSYRFFCNDHEIDDDFDDLIFELEIITD